MAPDPNLVEGWPAHAVPSRPRAQVRLETAALPSPPPHHTVPPTDLALLAHAVPSRPRPSANPTPRRAPPTCPCPARARQAEDMYRDSARIEAAFRSLFYRGRWARGAKADQQGSPPREEVRNADTAARRRFFLRT
eukprot:scaffold26724_cov120-Isochrysis_galbana.AAC.9